MRATPAFAPLQAAQRTTQPTPPPPVFSAAKAGVVAPETPRATLPVRDVLHDIYASETASSSALSAAPDTGALQEAAVNALSAAKSQSTAADAIADSEFLLADTSLTIQTAVSKTLLATVVNPEAEKLLRATINSLAPGLTIQILAGAAAAKSVAKRPRAAASGSAAARALEHPIVQEAQRLFNAEIRNVIDLSSSD
jgi:DNA polymerase-3 subunit gamma/tau